MKKQILMLIAVAVISLTGCGSDDPKHKAVQGDTLFSETFDQAGTWEEGQYPADAPTAFLAITEGRYQITDQAADSSSFIWGVGGTAAQDVIIEVETEQLSSKKDNLYGVGCRLNTDEDGHTTGYMLLISGDGHFGIARLKNRSLDFIQDWRQAGAIKQGQAKNTIRAVCVGDYLALSVNGDFLGDATDKTYAQTGQVGLIAGANQAEVTVTFDNLAVFEGTIAP